MRCKTRQTPAAAVRQSVPTEVTTQSIIVPRRGTLGLRTYLTTRKYRIFHNGIYPNQICIGRLLFLFSAPAC